METLEPGRDRLPECPEHGLRPEAQTRDYCDVADDFGHCGRFLIYPVDVPTINVPVRDAQRPPCNCNHRFGYCRCCPR